MFHFEKWIFACLTLAVCSAQAQNLVLNGGFEEGSNPTGVGGISKSLGWYDANEGNADYYRFTVIPEHWDSAKIGNRWVYWFYRADTVGNAGTETPHGGNAYSGIWVNTGPGGGREYLSGSLTKLLEKDQLYYFEMYVSLRDECSFGSKDMGVYFEFPDFKRIESRTILLKPDIINIEFITIKKGWVKFSGCYKAKGGEDRIIIGNFNEPSEMKPVPGGTNPRIYYYIDDVALIAQSSSIIESRDTAFCDIHPLQLKLHSAFSMLKGDVSISWLWKSGSTDSTFIVRDSGEYWVSVTTDKCILHDTIRVTNDRPEIDFGPDSVVCLGKTFIIKPLPIEPASQIRYLWSTGDRTPFIFVNQVGRYWLEVDRNGCKNRDSINIYQFPLKKFSLGPDTSFCSNSNFFLDATTIGATSYLWNNADTASSIYAFNQGLYWVEAINGTCKYRDSINLETRKTPIFELGNDTTICENSFILLDAGPSDSTNLKNISYSWNKGTTERKYFTNLKGFYQVEVTANGCTTSDSLFVFVDSKPFLELGPDTLLCEGNSVLLNAIFPGSTYKWDLPGGIHSALGELTIAMAGAYKVVVRKGACMVSDSVNISYAMKPVFNLGPDTGSCFRDPMLLQVPISGDGVYQWQDGSSDSSFIVSKEGLYWLEISRSVCTFRDSIDIKQYPVPNINLGTDTFICQGSSFVIRPTTDISTYSWSDGSYLPILKVSSPGNYWLTGINSFNCVAADSIFIDKQPLPVVTLGKDLLACKPDLVLDPGTFAFYEWKAPAGQQGDGSTSPTCRATDYGIYEVIVTDFNGCKNGSRVEVINDCITKVFVPNAFSPNGDGINDLLVPSTLNVRSWQMKIYNRWGQLVSEVSDATESWDGKSSNGEYAPGDVYTYMMMFTDVHSETGSLKGNVTLLR